MSVDQNRRAVVWAPSSEIGRAVARGAALTFGEVLLVDDHRDVADVAAELGTHHVLADRPGATAAWAADAWGGADVLMDCTSAMEWGPQAEDTLEGAAAVVAHNLFGPWSHVEELRDALGKGSAASVVLLGSVDGTMGNPNVSAYSAGKAAVASLTRTLAADLGPAGVRVNCVAAAGVPQSPLRDGAPRRTTGDPGLAKRLTPLGRFPTAGEIAEVVLFLASRAASGMSGAVVPVDAGRTAVTPGTWAAPGGG
ncbi:SDR family oxidoreductase [Citricoccus nitrophenolicus]